MTIVVDVAKYRMRILLVFFICFVWASAACADKIAIGVLAYNGAERALERWQPTADYLSQKIPSHQFHIEALTHEKFEHVIHKDKLSFILTNPGHYVRLEVDYGITRIATFLSKSDKQTLKQFSAVIFTRADSGIQHLEQLKGHSFAAVIEEAFGGFQLAQEALLNHGIDALEDMRVIWLGFPHIDIVSAVLSGKADVGTVRSGIIEKMAARGLLKMSDIRVLDQKKDDSFPYLRSFGLFPEWPIAKLPNTDIALAKQVAISLMQMQESDEAAIKSVGAGWTIPLNYTAVHNVLRHLEVEPYIPQPLSFTQIVQGYGHWLFIIMLLFLLSITALLRFIRANKKLQVTQLALHKHQGQLEEAVQQRTDELHQANLNLQGEILSHVKAEKILNHGCEALQVLYSIFLRDDLTRQQRMNSIVDSVRQYLDVEVAVLSHYHAGEFEVCCTSPSNAVVLAPLSSSLAMHAITNKQIYQKEQITDWQNYIACPVFIKGELHCLFEFATSSQYYDKSSQDKENISSELSLKLLNLISQWVGHEMVLLESEEREKNKYFDIQQRFATISNREKEVLALLVQGESTKSMARILTISTKTIEMHRASLLHKTAAKSSTELVQLAVLSGITQPIQ
ncbi:MAG: PhnD/SsuA/transferrin family substrate-binding protein [Pseudomonadota bacterium]